MIDTVRIAIFAALQDRKGISSLEYIVLAVAVLAGVTSAFNLLGGKLTTAVGNIGTALGLT